MSSPRAPAFVCFTVLGVVGAVTWARRAPTVVSPARVAPSEPAAVVSEVIPATTASGSAPVSAPASAPAAVASASPDPCAIPAAPAPTDPLSTLFHVNRVHAIPDEYPVAGVPLWTPCNSPAPPTAWPSVDLICVPRKAALHGNEAMRQVAWESPAPSDHPTTHDGLPVGLKGRVGFGPMITAAGAEGLELKIRSAFRPIGTQAYVFQTWVNERLRLGMSPADAEHHANASSARPGHSEHQLGTTADLVHRDRDGMYYEGWDAERISTSPPMLWLAANAHRFGLVLSYGRETTHVTQYIWEPWHYRFVGVEAADFLHRCKLPLEAYLRARHGDPEPPPFELPTPAAASSVAAPRGKPRLSAHGG